jgi:hypothetical protein
LQDYINNKASERPEGIVAPLEALAVAERDARRTLIKASRRSRAARRADVDDYSRSTQYNSRSQLLLSRANHASSADRGDRRQQRIKSRLEAAADTVTPFYRNRANFLRQQISKSRGSKTSVCPCRERPVGMLRGTHLKT